MEPDGDARVAEARHRDAAVEEWVFSAWLPDASAGVIVGHRIIGPTAWYWAALAREGRPLLHVCDFDIAVRDDPFIVKGEALWAEQMCDEPMRQWSIGNETYASAIDDASEALGRAFGVPTPIAFDLEWYANAPPSSLACGYEQRGVVHGDVDILGEPRVVLTEVPAYRWHRWSADEHGIGPLTLPVVRAHGGVRAPFAFPDGSVSDLVLTPDGWALRRSHRR